MPRQSTVQRSIRIPVSWVTNLKSQQLPGEDLSDTIRRALAIGLGIPDGEGDPIRLKLWLMAGMLHRAVVADWPEMYQLLGEMSEVLDDADMALCRKTAWQLGIEKVRVMGAGAGA